MSLFLKLLGEQPISLKIDVGQVISIGRSPQANLALDDNLVSRRHCEIEGLAGGLLIRDLRSRNGTELNGQRIAEAVARPGDHLRVGRAALLVDRQRERAPRSGTARLESGEKKRPAGAHPTKFLPSLPGYQLIERIAEGSNSTVFRARAARGGEVAIKLLEAGATAEARARFLRGAEALAGIDHPNVAKVIDVCDAESSSFYAMALIDGTPLDRLLENEPLGLREALSIGIQIARALKVLHGAELVHRDLRPENVIVLHGGVAKLTGFGFVRDLSRSDDVVGLGDPVGSTAHIAPEQATDPRSADQRSDLYALGALVFHLVAGRPPFLGGRLECFRKVLAEPAPRLRELVSTTSKLLEAVVSQLLEKDPANRFESAEAVELALDHALLTSCRPDPDPAPTPSGDDGEAGGADGMRATQTRLTAVSAPQTAFAGGFAGLELLEIVQFLEVQAKEGRLVVTTATTSGELFLTEGQIVHAQAGTSTGKAAARELLSLPEGTFEFHGADESPCSPPSGAPRLSLRPSSIVPDIMRTIDEARV